MRTIHKKKLYSILLLITIIILIIFIRNLKLTYLKVLELKIEETHIKNNLNYYRQLYLSEEKNNNSQIKNLDLEAKAVELIEKSGSQGLELIHYSSSNQEIILNFQGDFKPLFYFLSWIEITHNYLEIDNLKLKKDGEDLFCYLRLIRTGSLK